MNFLETRVYSIEKYPTFQQAINNKFKSSSKVYFSVFLDEFNTEEIDRFSIVKKEDEDVLSFSLRYLNKVNSLEEELEDGFHVFLQECSEVFHKVLDSDFRVQPEHLRELGEFYNQILVYNGQDHPFDYFVSHSLAKMDKSGFLIQDHPKYSGRFTLLMCDSTEIFKLKYLLYIGLRDDLNKIYHFGQGKALLEDFLNESSVPLALFNAFDDLIIHNKPFRDMNLLSTETLKLDNGQKIENSNFFYTIKREELVLEGAKFSLIIFLKEISFSDKYINSDELGIITSSIAHELNNPIGGILSGAEVLLSLSPKENIDERELLDEVKKSAKRCSALIKTFLGFSRKVIEDDEESDLGESVSQAGMLLRTRLVENNIIFKFEMDQIKEKKIKNQSVWTMILYIMFSNILNMILRKKLVSGKTTNSVSIVFTRNNRAMFFSTSERLSKSIYDELLLSPFFFHLLEQENLNLELEEDKIVFINENLDS